MAGFRLVGSGAEEDQVGQAGLRRNGSLLCDCCLPTCKATESVELRMMQGAWTHTRLVRGNTSARLRILVAERRFRAFFSSTTPGSAASLVFHACETVRIGASGYSTSVISPASPYCALSSALTKRATLMPLSSRQIRARVCVSESSRCPFCTTLSLIPPRIPPRRLFRSNR